MLEKTIINKKCKFRIKQNVASIKLKFMNYGLNTLPWGTPIDTIYNREFNSSNVTNF